MSVQLQEPRFDTNSHGSYRPGRLTEGETRVVSAGFANVKYLAWHVFSKLFLGVFVIGVVSEGARRMIPSLGQKVFKVVPIFDGIDHRIDLAHCFALVLLLGTWWSWSGLLEAWLGIKPYSRATTITLPLAFVFISVDTTLFYVSTAHWSWGGSHFSGTAALATAGYVAVLVFVAFVTVQLKDELRKAKS
jgi:hypothetical protein